MLGTSEKHQLHYLEIHQRLVSCRKISVACIDTHVLSPISHVELAVLCRDHVTTCNVEDETTPWQLRPEKVSADRYRRVAVSRMFEPPVLLRSARNETRQEGNLEEQHHQSAENVQLLSVVCLVISLSTTVAFRLAV